MVAFHAQQCVEKCLKALLEEFDIEIGKTHNLLSLKATVERKCPGELVLLPTGAPDSNEAEVFANFAEEAMQKVETILSK
jgi:hypothetical protein